MTKEDLEQLGQVLDARLDAKLEPVNKRLDAIDKRLDTIENDTASIKNGTHEVIVDMADFFRQTWAKMDESNERVTIIEEHLGLENPTKKN